MQTHKELLSRTSPTVRDSPTKTILEMIQVALCYTRVFCTLQREKTLFHSREMFTQPLQISKKQTKVQPDGTSCSARLATVLIWSCNSPKYIVATSDDVTEINQLRCGVTELKCLEQKKIWYSHLYPSCHDVPPVASCMMGTEAVCHWK